MAKKIVERRFYLVRHAEDLRSVDGVQRGLDGGLTRRGRYRAHKLVDRMKKRKIKKLISSPATRALATAKPIAKLLGVPIEISDLFPERRRPSFAIGAHENEPAVRRQLGIIDELYPLTGQRHSDEEDRKELLARVIKALAFLLTQPHTSIGVITHNIFMRAIFAYVYSGGLSQFEFNNAYDKLDIPHTGIMTLCYKQAYRSDKMIWKIKFD